MQHKLEDHDTAKKEFDVQNFIHPHESRLISTQATARLPPENQKAV